MRRTYYSAERSPFNVNFKTPMPLQIDQDIGVHRTADFSKTAKDGAPLEPPLPQSGERAVWLAVIWQAMCDALIHSTPIATEGLEVQRVRQEARDWFEKPNRGFIEVCTMAGLDPSGVREVYMQRKGD